MKVALITGVTGQDGSYLAELLISKGYLVHGLIRCDKVNRPGHLFVLAGRRTFSAAMNGAVDVERNTNALFVGEPTGSSPNFVGEEEPFTLPYSKLRVNISTLAWQSSYPQDRRTWIAPTLYTPLRFGDIGVSMLPLNHPNGSLSYRLEHEGRRIVYATDHEHGVAATDSGLVRFAERADHQHSDQTKSTFPK